MAEAGVEGVRGEVGETFCDEAGAVLRAGLWSWWWWRP